MRWRHLRAATIALAILLGLIQGCPVPIEPVQRTLLAPVDWIARGVRFHQRWALFTGASPDRFRLEIHTRTWSNTDAIIYRAGDREHAEYADWLVQRHLRGAWNPNVRGVLPGQYAAFTRWLAQQIFAERPEVGMVWFRYERIAIEDGVPRGLGLYVFDVYHHRTTR
ncbi:MAG: hypothetical protein ABI867_20770 [Kofleriaceae bacterium]